MISLICDDSVTKNESILEYVGQDTDPAIIYVSIQYYYVLFM